MDAVTVSPTFQIAIPGRARRLLDVRAGQKIRVILYDDRIELIPVKPIQEMRGFLKGMDTTVKREPDRL